MTFSASDLVLVTGANGHLAQHIIDQLLSIPDASPRVRGTVRSDSKAVEIRKFYAKQIDDGRLEISVVNDITADGAFDLAVKDATHVAHVASPLVIDQSNIERDVLNPAINGTTSILASAAKEPSIRKVVVTSSDGAIIDMGAGWRPGYTYTEDDWLPLTREDALNPHLELPNAVPELVPWAAYAVSKVLAEKAAWNFVNSASVSFALATVHPSYIFGPSILPLKEGAKSLSLSNALIWDTATRNGEPHIQVDWPHMADVRDVARGHVLALSKEEANGQRFLLSGHRFYYSDIADIVRKNFPSLNPSSGPSQSNLEHYRISNEKSVKTLGIGSYISLEQSVVDTLKQVVS